MLQKPEGISGRFSACSYRPRNEVTMAQRTEAEGVRPVLVDLGSVRGRTVREFKEGCGPLVDDVQQVLAEVRQNLGPEAATKELVPIVLIYRRKRKGKKGRGSLFCL
jgi:hypothetical protein